MAVQEQNYWPGFVDALSNVVLTLVFVLVVFVMALLIMSNKVESRAQQMIQEIKEKHKNVVPIVELEEKLQQAQKKIEELQRMIEKQEEPKAGFQLPAREADNTLKSKFIKIQKFKDRITLDYPYSTVGIEEDVLKEFDDFLLSIRGKMDGHEIFIYSYLGPEPYTAARRLAYYRILNVRNHILSLQVGGGEHIKTKIIEDQERRLGRVEVVFE